MNIPVLDSIPDQIFLSYSSEETNYATCLDRALSKHGFKIWRDRKSLEAGSPDWQEEIRTAIEGSFAVLMICSPGFRQSLYCKAEIAIAQSLKKPILPIWANGDRWADCAPFEFLSAQNIECRPRMVELAPAPAKKVPQPQTPETKPGDKPMSPLERMRAAAKKKKGGQTSQTSTKPRQAPHTEPADEKRVSPLQQLKSAAKKKKAEQQSNSPGNSALSPIEKMRLAKTGNSYPKTHPRHRMELDEEPLQKIVSRLAGYVQTALPDLFVSPRASLGAFRRGTFDCPKSHFAVNACSYPTIQDRNFLVIKHANEIPFQDLLNLLFDVVLKNIVSPMSYGNEWILIDENIGRILVPFEWILPHQSAGLALFDRRRFQQMTLQEAGISPGANLRITSPLGMDAVGILAEESSLVQQFIYDSPKSAHVICDYVTAFDTLDSWEEFTYRAIFAKRQWPLLAGTIYAQIRSFAESGFASRSEPPWAEELLNCVF